ncbi:MAG: class C sortase [Tissierellia bacterium]|nr:class C sortase [Tissierellia bacterium]
MKREKRSFKKILAYILIMAGVFIIILPFIKRSINNFTAKRKYEDFLEKSDPKRALELEKKALDYNKNIKESKNALVDPFTEKNFDSQTILEDKDEIFAYISIPKINKYLPIYLDASMDHIAMGVAQMSGTDIPIGGKSTRSVIAGHRGWWDDTMFLYVDDLKAGDSIFIERHGKRLEYQVFSKEVIKANQWEKLEPIEGEDVLTLLTCHPFFPPMPDRLLVNAKRVKDQEVEPEIEINIEDNYDKKEDNREQTRQQVSSKAKLISRVPYIISTLGLIIILFLLVKFIRYIIFNK